MPCPPILAKENPVGNGTQDGAVLFAPPSKSCRFSHPPAPRARSMAQGISLSANRCKTGSKISPAALSWSSLIKKRFHNAFFFSPAFSVWRFLWKRGISLKILAFHRLSTENFRFSTLCGNRRRHLPDFPRISPQVFRFHSTIFPPFHPQKISPLLHDFSTKGSWKKNLRRFRQKNGFPLFLPLYNCY